MLVWTEQSSLFAPNCIKLLVSGLAGFLSTRILKMPTVKVPTCQSPVESLKWLVLWSLGVHECKKEWYLFHSHPCYEKWEEKLQIAVRRNAMLLLQLVDLYTLDMGNLVCRNYDFFSWLQQKNLREIWDSPRRWALYTTSPPSLFYFFTFISSHSIYEKAVGSTSKIYLNPSFPPSTLLLMSTVMIKGATSISTLDHFDRPLTALLYSHSPLPISSPNNTLSNF